MGSELLLIRHGNAPGSVSLWWADRPLDAIGRAEAERTGTWLAQTGPIDAIYSSPLRRAWETSGIIGRYTGVCPERLDDLREAPVGVLFATFAHQLVERTVSSRYGGRLVSRAQDASIRQRTLFRIRVYHGVLRILQRHPDQRVALVCHGGTISAALTALFPAEAERWWSAPVHTASVTRVEVDSAGAQLLDYNLSR